MRRHTLLALSVGLLSCNSFKAKIELRGKNCEAEIANSKAVYLINTSTSKTIKVTVRQTGSLGNGKDNYQIFIYKLIPGDEKYIGCTDNLSPVEYEKKHKLIIGTYEEFKKNNEPSIQLLVETKGMSDTIINGKKQQYYYDNQNDYSTPKKRVHTQFEYAITGEVVVPNE